MDSNWRRIRRLLQFAGVAVGGLAVALSPNSSRAFTYNTGDLVTVFVNGGNEFIADLGPLSSLTSGTTVTLSTSSSLGGTGALGGTVTAFQTVAPFSGTPRTIVFTTDPSIHPPNWDNNAIVTHPSYTAGIQGAQSSLDTGSTGGSPDFLQNLNGITAGGTGVIFVGTSTLGLSATNNPSSYTNQIGLGTNTVNNNLPFSTAATLATTVPSGGQVVDLWQAVNTALNKSTTTLIGTLAVNGNVTGDGSTISLTFTAVPEPGTLVLVAAGLSGLVWVGRGRRTR